MRYLFILTFMIICFMITGEKKIYKPNFVFLSLLLRHYKFNITKLQFPREISCISRKTYMMCKAPT